MKIFFDKNFHYIFWRPRMKKKHKPTTCSLTPRDLPCSIFCLKSKGTSEIFNIWIKFLYFQEFNACPEIMGDHERPPFLFTTHAKIFSQSECTNYMSIISAINKGVHYFTAYLLENTQKFLPEISPKSQKKTAYKYKLYFLPRIAVHKNLIGWKLSFFWPWILGIFFYHKKIFAAMVQVWDGILPMITDVIL
jgi:hypothetical protein